MHVCVRFAGRSETVTRYRFRPRLEFNFPLSHRVEGSETNLGHDWVCIHAHPVPPIIPYDPFSPLFTETLTDVAPDVTVQPRLDATWCGGRLDPQRQTYRGQIKEDRAVAPGGSKNRGCHGRRRRSAQVKGGGMMGGSSTRSEGGDGTDRACSCPLFL